MPGDLPERSHLARRAQERQLVAQYNELKKSGQLDKFLEKRRKKVAAKQRKRLPAKAAEIL